LKSSGRYRGLTGATPVIVNTAYPLFKMDFRAHHATSWVEKSSNTDPLISAVRQIVEPDSESGGNGGK